MELYASEYRRQLKQFLGITDDWTPGLVVQAKSSVGSDLLMVQSYGLWKAMTETWDGHLWPLWPRPVQDALEVWDGFFAYYEMRPIGLEVPSVILCTTPEIHSNGITPVRIARDTKETK